jgi:apolipoprotein N-acyltransferase
LKTANILIEQEASSWRFFKVMYLGLLLWNVLCTWWIYYATLGGVLMAVIANSALMTIPFFCYRLSIKAKVPKLAAFFFLLSWMGFEYIHHNWSLSWPWLTLGNGLAKIPSIIQWYEFTGTGGGSLWILLLSLVVFSMLVKFKKSQVIFLVVLFIVPILISLTIRASVKSELAQNKKKVEVVALQPNFNTYTQKSRNGDYFIPYDEQLEHMISASEKMLSQETEFLVWPETAISGSNRESFFYRNGEYKTLKNFLIRYPNLTLVAGIDSYEICKDQENPTQFASYSDYVGYYEPYNAAIMMTKDSMAFYHKSKFVPGAEQVPFPWLIKPIELLLGGVGFGHFFGQEEQIPFESIHEYKAAPSICYESIFGEHMTQFVKNGADILFVLTNDDWWHDTEGHRQHFDFARMRAIENRISLVRSANTGFSGFIDALGEDSQKTIYRHEACIIEKVAVKKEPILTFYAKYGDYLGKTALYIAVLLLISLLVKRFTPKK